MKYLILAGGSGTRLWPLSRKMFAKQFLSLTNRYSLLQNTALRVKEKQGSDISNDILIVSNRSSRFVIFDQMRSILPDFPHENLVTEPLARNTAPAIAYGCLYCDPDDVVTVLSSDHHIKDDKVFLETLHKADTIAGKGHIVTLGIVPDGPKTGYGYIHRDEGKKIGDGFAVDTFTEKPDRKKAEEYLASGGYYWNAGIFTFKVKTFFEELEKHSPNVYKVAMELQEEIKKGNEITEEHFGRFENISIDYAVMEKSDKLVVIPSRFGWNDVGSFEALYDILPKDENGNAFKITSTGIIDNSSRNLLIFGSTRRIATIGLENLVIVDTPDALLVSDKSSTEEVKSVVNKLKEQNSDLVNTHLTVYRPWGSYTSLDSGTGDQNSDSSQYQVKRLSLDPGKRISYQYHKYRSETWTVVSGVAEVTKDDEVITLKPSESIFIPAYTRHRLTNPLKDQELHVIEVQTGTYLGEDDIIRLEDDYSRV
jgi:mannose-1-phosphate guanylyltransferase/mannose-6-phosphate isomerase